MVIHFLPGPMNLHRSPFALSTKGNRFASKVKGMGQKGGARRRKTEMLRMGGREREFRAVWKETVRKGCGKV